MSPALVITRPRPPAWRLALALSLRAMPVFLALWLRHLRHLRRRLDRRQLITALRQHQLDAQSTVGPEVERLLATPMREDLTTHGIALAFAALAAVQPDITRQTGISLPVPAEHPALRTRVDTYVHEQLAFILATTLLAAQAVIRQGTQQGLSPDVLARKVQATLGLTPGQVQAREAMRTRLSAQGLPPRTIQAQLDQATEQAIQRRAMAMGQTQAVALTQMGVHEAWEDAVIAGAVAASQITRHWIVTEDPRLCPQCAVIPDMNRGGVGLEESFRTPWGPTLLPPTHPNCLTGDAFVTTVSPITAVSKRWYEGEVIVLGTTHKKFLTCTPNHPILTRNGWVAANLLRKGDSIVCGSRKQRVVISNDDIETVPTMIEEIVDTWHSTGGMTSTEVPTAPEDFHGDGKGSKVAIIGTYGLLGNSLYPTVSQPFRHESFQSRRMLPFLLDRACRALPSFAWISTPTNCCMCCGSLLSPLYRGHLRPLERFGFRLRTSRDVMFQQTPFDKATTDTIALRQSIFRNSLLIQEEQLLHVERRIFSGHVYNLQTGNGWYIGNGIITHNCRCAVEYRVYQP